MKFFTSKTIYILIPVIFFILNIFMLVPANASSYNSEIISLSDGWMYKHGDSPLNDQGLPIWILESPTDWQSVDTLSQLEDIPENIEITWFKINIPAGNWKNPCIYFEKIYGQSIQAYHASNKIFERERVLWPFTNSSNLEIIPLSRDNLGNNLYLRVVSGSVLKDVGPRSTVLIGDADKLINLYSCEKINRILLNLVVGSIFMFLGLIIIFLYFFLKKMHVKSLISIGILTFASGIIIALGFNELYLIFGDYEIYSLIVYDLVKIIFLNLLLFMFIQLLGWKYRMPVIKKMLWFQNVYAFVCYVLLILLLNNGYEFYSVYRLFSYDLMGILYIVQSSLLIITTIYYSYKKDSEARIILMGFLSCIFLMMVDFGMFFILDRTYKLSLWFLGVLLLIFSFLILLAKRISSDHLKVAKYSEELAELNKTLEIRVEDRTKQMELINKELSDTNNALHSTNEELIATMETLKEMQAQLIQSEKMAAIGQLAAGVAHEINTPLGVIQASISNTSDYLNQIYKGFSKISELLTNEEQILLFNLIQSSINNDKNFSTMKERELKKNLVIELNKLGVSDVENIADILSDMGMYEEIEKYLPIFNKTEHLFLLQTAFNLSGLHRNCSNIGYAILQASKMVIALKNYSRQDNMGEMIKVDIISGIELVLTLYYNKIKHKVEITKNYSDVEEIMCYPDELNQVWTNLLLNALQAMDFSGKLEIEVFQDNEYVFVNITDSGKGIPDDIKDKIFLPFFTTKHQGEGTGLGLDIVKKIINKHKGDISVRSVPGNTKFTVKLPT